VARRAGAWGVAGQQGPRIDMRWMLTDPGAVRNAGSPLRHALPAAVQSTSMLGLVGSLRIRRRTARRIELALTRSTHVVGWSLTFAAVALAIWLATVSLVFASIPAVGAGIGLVIATMRQRLIFDRDDGVLRVEQRLVGFPSHQVVPLFHLRAVVVRSRPRGGFVALVERRVGDPIVLDSADSPGPLYALAQAVAEVAQLRLVYDATAAAR